jgi:hypothetical protein
LIVDRKQNVSGLDSDGSRNATWVDVLEDPSMTVACRLRFRQGRGHGDSASRTWTRLMK